MIPAAKFRKIFTTVARHRVILQFKTPGGKVYDELVNILNSVDFIPVDCNTCILRLSLQRPFIIAVTPEQVYYVGDTPHDIVYEILEKYNIPVKITFNFNLKEILDL